MSDPNILTTKPAAEAPQHKVRLDERVKQFIDLRDKRKAIEDKHKEELKPFAEMERLLSASIMQLLDEVGTENARTQYGTAFITIKSSVSLEDPDAFMRHVIGTGQFELLDRKANKTACEAFMKENDGMLPPGAKLSRMRTIGVHKKVGGGPDVD